MPVTSKYLSALEKLFGKKPVALLEELYAALGTASRTSVFRILSAVGYRTSFSHAGRYYTLKDIPKFDAQGLWFYQRIGFSVCGTLRATLIQLITQAPAGLTHLELQARLGLRVHDTLRSLVGSQSVGRQQYQDAYLYLSAQAEQAAAQLARRETALRSAAADCCSGMDPSLVIDVLVAVLHHPKEDAQAIATRLTSISPEQVTAILKSYQLQKKTVRSRWRPWPL